MEKKEFRVLQQLVAQETAEQELVKGYRRAAQTASDRGVRFFVKLILDDEERHSRLISALADQLQRPSEAYRTEGIPAIEFADDPELLPQTERFIDLEQQALTDLQRIRQALKPRQSVTLQIVLDLMIADTKKHLTLLNHIKDRLDSGARSDFDWEILSDLVGYGTTAVRTFTNMHGGM
ncbi:MAG: hypothetical protein KGJ86_03060 [Chloroflexota bacterium]|nr:hypothetical protein [Chloroflexota bacterium]